MSKTIHCRRNEDRLIKLGIMFIAHLPVPNVEFSPKTCNFVTNAGCLNLIKGTGQRILLNERYKNDCNVQVCISSTKN